MTLHARGTFVLQLTPQPLANQEAGPGLGRLAIAIADGVHNYDLAYTLPEPS